MIRLLKEIYFTGFTVFFRFRPNQSIAIRAGRAAAALTIIEWFFLLGIFLLTQAILRRVFLPKASEFAIAIVFVALFQVNLFVLFARGYGIKFEREFDHLEKSRKTFLMASFVVLALATIGFFASSFVATRHFIHAH